mmetsp:Transcript_50520/g.118564  ORF Transcript_50520/g.118564 Transcript_50520/m.118564 type:complete len:166 (-) Transcript_50520:286-783(-)
MAVDAGGQGPDSDNYNKENDPTTSPDVETHVQKLNFLSRSRFPSTQKMKESESKDGTAKKDKSEKGKMEPRAEEEAHVLGAWLLDEKVMELLKIHQDAKKKGASQPEVSQTRAKGKGTSKTMPEARSEAKHDAGPNTPPVASSTASASIQGQSSSAKPRKTLISL